MFQLGEIQQVLVTEVSHDKQYYVGHNKCYDQVSIQEYVYTHLNGPHQGNLVLIAYASSEGSGEPAHPHSLARTSVARSYKQ